jgi:hypothetical protein
LEKLSITHTITFLYGVLYYTYYMPKKGNTLILVILFLSLVILVLSGVIYSMLLKNKPQFQSNSLIQQNPSPVQNLENNNPSEELHAEPLVKETPNSDISSDSTLYTDTENNFSFKYPSHYQFKRDNSALVSISRALSDTPECTSGGCNLGPLMLVIAFEPAETSEERNMSLDDYSKYVRNNAVSLFPNQSSLTKLEKFGRDIRFYEGDGVGYYHNYLVQPNPGNNLSIHVGFPSKDGVDLYKEEVEEILATVKFGTN